jgi:Fe-S cluster assembly protein SufD
MNNTAIDKSLLKRVSQLPKTSASGQSGNPTWMTSLQESAGKLYQSQALPDRTQHLWRYTDPSLFLFSDGSKSEQNGAPGVSPAYDTAMELLAVSELAVVAFDDADGALQIEMTAEAKSAGLVALSLAEAGAESEYKELIERHLAKTVGAEFGKFEALNTTLWENGIFVFAPDNTTIEAPIHLLRRGSASTRWTFPRTLIIAGESSRLTVVDEYYSANATVNDNSNAVVEVFGQAGSEVEYVVLQRNNAHTLSHFTERTTLADNARTTLVAASFGGKSHKANLGTIMQGRQTRSLQYGLVFGSNKQSFDHHTEHVNRGANGYSNLDFKVVLKDKSHSAYTGLIRVDENVPNCEAYQSNRNLLLNRGAKAESIPELEILCDEVICTHGATVGPIDEMQVFYLLSRGIPRREAVKMIVRGHVEPTLKLLPGSLQPRVRSYVDERLETL